MEKRLILIILIAIIFVLGFLLVKTANKNSHNSDEILRVHNNLKAANDSLKNYKNAQGYYEAEMKTLNLNLNELQDSVFILKNRKPITKIEYQTKIVEKIINIPVRIVDTLYFTGNSIAKINSNEKWEKSYRNIEVTVPYKLEKDSVIFENSSINLEQNLWIETQITQDPITKEFYLNLSTDYPYTNFTEGKSILINQPQKKKDVIGIGLTAGWGISKAGYSPFFGIGINYTPKLLQKGKK
jgi:hypothetical protein